MRRRSILALTLLLGSCSGSPNSGPAATAAPDAFEQARAAYFADHYRQADSLFRGCVARRERLPESLYYRGCSLVALDSLPEALKVLKAAVDAAQEGRLVHEGRYTRGISVADSSETALTAAITEQMGRAYYGLGQYDQAFNAFLLTQIMNPEAKTMTYNMGVALLARGDYSRAASLLRRYYQAGNADTQVGTALAKAYLLQHKPDSARIFLHATFRLNPGYAPALDLQRKLDSLTKTRLR